MSEAAEEQFDDLAAGDPETPEGDAPEAANPETDAPEGGERVAESPKVAPFTPEQQAIFDETIGKKVAKQREAERKAEELERKYQEAQQKLAQLEAPVRPDIPPLPDPYEDNYAQKVQERDALIAAAARWDGQQAYAQQLRQQQEQETARQQQQQFFETAQTYTKKAEVLGISPEELQQAGMVVAQYGIPDHLTHRILRDDKGPEITAYLGKNIAELDMLARMSEGDAAVYLETVVKPKAKRAPPAKIPAPAESPGGAGFPESQKGPKGATYE